jgi:glutamine amidotransferase
MLNFLGIEFQICHQPPEKNKITHLILPGVGSFDSGARLLKQSGWSDVIQSLPKNTNILGICLGMQLLTSGSEEGTMPGLGLIDGYCIKFDSLNSKVPHVGWNKTMNISSNNFLFDNVDDPYFYFSHSYFVESSNKSIIMSETFYSLKFISSVKQGNTYGLQFHPEKSNFSGMKLLTNFSNLTC